MSTWREIAFPVLLIAAVSLSGCRKTTGPPEAETVGPVTAQAVSAKAEPLEVPGCPNLHRISEALYRGAQPEAEGFARLQKLGVKTVLNLRSAHSDRELLRGLGLDYVEVEMKAWDPDYDEVKRALQVLVDPERQPVFVHCQHGADRTGTVIAAWRVVVGGWTKEQAVEEMTKGPYGFHDIWITLPKFIRDLNVERLREELDAAAGQAPRP